MHQISVPIRSGQPQQLKCSLTKVAIEDGINVFEDIGIHLKKLALVLDWDEGPLGAMVHRHLQRFGE